MIKHKIMESVRLAEVDLQLQGRVEIDDAYLDGERPGAKARRGLENKIRSGWGRPASELCSRATLRLRREASPASCALSA